MRNTGDIRHFYDDRESLRQNIIRHCCDNRESLRQYIIRYYYGYCENLECPLKHSVDLLTQYDGLLCFTSILVKARQTMVATVTATYT